MVWIFFLLLALCQCAQIQYINENRIDVLSSLDEYPRVTAIKLCVDATCRPIYNYTANDNGVIHVNSGTFDAIYTSLNLYGADGEFVKTTVVKTAIPPPKIYVEPTHSLVWVYSLVGLIAVVGIVFGIAFLEKERREPLVEYVL